MDKFLETVNYLESKVQEIPKIAIILGSGLGSLADEIENKTVIDECTDLITKRAFLFQPFQVIKEN